MIMWARPGFAECETYRPAMPDDAGCDMAVHGRAAYEELEEVPLYLDLDGSSLEARLPLYVRLQGLCTCYAEIAQHSPDDVRLAVYLSIVRRTSSLRWLRTQETDMLELVAQHLEQGVRRFASLGV